MRRVAVKVRRDKYPPLRYSITMKDQRPVHFSAVVILVLLLLALPAGATGVGKSSSTAQGTAASSAEAGSQMELSAAAPPDRTPQTDERETTARGISNVPTSSTKSIARETKDNTKDMVVTTISPAVGNSRPDSGGSPGSGDETIRAPATTTLPVATPSVTLSSGTTRAEGNDAGKTAGGSASTSGPTAVPTATMSNSGSTQARNGGDGAGQGSPDGKEATARSTVEAKTGSTATVALRDAPVATPAAGGSGSTGAGQSPQNVEMAVNGSGTPVGTGWLLSGGSSAGWPFPGPPVAPATGTRVAENGEPSGEIGSDRGPGPGSSVAAAGPTSRVAGSGDSKPVSVTGVTDNRPREQVNRSSLSSVHGAGAGNVAAHGGPFPTISQSQQSLYTFSSGARVGKTPPLRPGDSSRDGTRGDPHPQNTGRERVPPTVPAAAPVRTGLEPFRQEPIERSGGRSRRTPLALPFTAETHDGVPDPLLLLRFLLFLGYRRIRPGNVLDHPMRRDLASAIMVDPGLDLAGCVAVTGANRETLRYHLAILVCAGKVMEETRNGSVRYFPHDPTLTSSHRAVLHHSRNPSLGPLLHYIRDVPGISRRELAERLGVAGPSVTRQVKRLVDEGLVENRGGGLSQGYWLTPGCADAFTAIAMAQTERNRDGQVLEMVTA